MPRKRMINPDIWTDPKFVSLTDDTTRLLFIGLFSNANDYGKLRGEWWSIRSMVFPINELPQEKIESMLEELEKTNLIARYKVKDERYVKLTNWEKHQKVQHPSPDTIPDPSGEIPAESLKYPLIEPGRYYGPNWEEQQKKARTRDGFKCGICGKSTKENKRSLDVHHIKPFSYFITWDKDGNKIFDWKKANELSNLITLCRKCHNKVDKGVREPFVSHSLAIHTQEKLVEVRLVKDKLREVKLEKNAPFFYQILEILKTIKNYPFELETDLDYLISLWPDFRNLDILNQVKDWKVWLIDNKGKLGKKINYRLRLRHWLEIAKKRLLERKASEAKESESTKRLLERKASERDQAVTNKEGRKRIGDIKRKLAKKMDVLE